MLKEVLPKKLSFSTKIWLSIASLFLACLLYQSKEAGPSLFSAENQNLDVEETCLSFIEGNSILATSPLPEDRVTREIKVLITAYSSSVWQTDDTPYLTASGTYVREGIVANNLLPFGTEIRFPEIYGEKIFVVEDRMDWTKGNYHIDIWFPSYYDALNFGAKRTYMEVLEN